MRARMTSESVFTYDLSATVCAVFWRLDSEESIHRLASRIAAGIARAVFGDFVTNFAVVPSVFSGWSFQIACVVIAVKPIPSTIARLPQGSPTQNPSMLPTRMLATICGGGTTTAFASLKGWMPFAASQQYSHIACVPVGQGCAKVYSRFA